MSIRIMTFVWDMDLTNPIRKLIALKLADNANDEGVCWPSIPTIARQANCSERSVKTHISNLVESGFMSIRKSKGRNNVYQIDTSALFAPVRQIPDTSAGDSLPVVQEIPKPVQELPPNHKEPSNKPSINNIKGKPNACSLEWGDIELTDDQKNDIKGIRQASKKKLTQLALNPILKEFIKAKNQYGIDYQESIEIWAVRGWVAYQADWAANHKGINNGKPQQNQATLTNLGDTDF